MNIFIILFFSLALSFVLVFLVKKVGIIYRFFDEAREDKIKIHKKPIVYLGGIGIFTSFAFTFFIYSFFYEKELLSKAAGIFLAGLVVILLGFWDDYKWKKGEPRPVAKFMLQAIASLVAIIVLVSTQVIKPMSFNTEFGYFIFLFYIVGAMNAMNMEDGMDGLAGGITSISLIGFGIISIISGTNLTLFISVALLGSIMGFLFYNWNPASIFMGDNGSHFLGFSLAVLAIILSLNNFTSYTKFFAALLIIGLSIFDAAWVIIKRILRGTSPLMGDREHLYDKINARGYSVKKTVLIYYFIQTILVFSGVIFYIV